MQTFPPPESRHTFTVRDLLEARDICRVALANLNNVIATAIGRYRMRDDEKNADRIRGREERGERTLFNSSVRPESWPAVLVFVREWADYDALQADQPRQMIPPFLYLPDGRAVPTCIIKLDLEQCSDRAGITSAQISFPENLIGGGCGVYTKVQGAEHVGTVACLVTDGERQYALTARHVAGSENQPVYTRVRGEEVCVGRSDKAQRRKVPFRELYPDYTGEAVMANLDAGLVQFDQGDWWTSQVLGLGALNDLSNLSCGNITLGMIGTPLRAYGAISKDRMFGEICALFPRYRSMGGVDHVADVLIAARKTEPDKFRAHRGDSGSLWVLDEPEAAGNGATPVAVTWGAVDFVGGGTSRQLVLASFLSNICKALDLEVVSQQNIGYEPIWGGKKHRSIAKWALEFLIAKDNPLAEFLTGLDAGSARAFALVEQFSVLPDGWKGHAGRKDENPNHYANINLGGQKTLANIDLTPKAWLNFYARHDKTNSGALPFRIGDVFDAIVVALKAKKWRDAFAAMGVMIHYVSDACNPAHVNWWGRGDHSWDGSRNGPRARFHSVWDEPPGVRFDNVQQMFESLRNPIVKIADGTAARAAALKLMKNTLRLVDVKQFVMEDDEDAKKSIAASREFCKSAKGADAVAKCIAGGCATLLSMWQSAWDLGLGGRPVPAFSDADADGLNAEKLDDPDFLPSIPLAQMA